MAGFTPGTNVAQVVMQYLLDNQPVENVWWFLGTAAWDATSLEALADAMSAWEIASALALRTTNCAFERVIATDWSTRNGAQVTEAAGLPLDGDQTNPLPNHATIAIKHGTGVRGRSFRGRHFWIGLDRSFTADNTVTSAFITLVETAYTAVDPAVGSVNGAQHVVFSQFHNGVRRSSGVATVVQVYTVDQFIDSQRRRLPGHNRHH